MKVLIACEYSGIVRDAFARRGFDAVSCDLLPTESPGNHIQGDVRDIIGNGWDLMIAHPPCTHLAVSGARWFKEKIADGRQQRALDFVRLLLDAPVEFIALENPVSIISTRVRKPDQVIQPWQYGHGETKATCLWLKGLPPLEPTNIVEGRDAKCHKLPPSEDRWKIRSKTYKGIAEAMADQWGKVLRRSKKRFMRKTVFDVMQAVSTVSGAVAAGVCNLCGDDVLGFRDPLSEREYEISGMCQACQNRSFNPGLKSYKRPGDDEKFVEGRELA